VGALIGGIGSWAGAYLTYKAQTQTHTQDVKAAAYGKLTNEAQRFIGDLRQLATAATASDQTSYATFRAKLIQLNDDVFQASATVYIVSDNGKVVDTATKLNNALLRYSPADLPTAPTGVDLNNLNSTRGQSSKLLDDFSLRLVPT